MANSAYKLLKKASAIAPAGLGAGPSTIQPATPIGPPPGMNAGPASGVLGGSPTSSGGLGTGGGGNAVPVGFMAGKEQQQQEQQQQQMEQQQQMADAQGQQAELQQQQQLVQEQIKNQQTIGQLQAKHQQDLAKANEQIHTEKLKMQQELQKKDLENKQQLADMQAQLAQAQATQQSAEKRMLDIQSQAPSGVSPIFQSKSKRILSKAESLRKKAYSNGSYALLKEAVDYNATSSNRIAKAKAQQTAVKPAPTPTAPAATGANSGTPPVRKPDAKDIVPPTPNVERQSWWQALGGGHDVRKGGLAFNKEFRKNPLEFTHNPDTWNNRSFTQKALQVFGGFDGSELERDLMSKGMKTEAYKPVLGESWGNAARNLGHNVSKGLSLNKHKYNTIRALARPVDQFRNYSAQDIIAPTFSGVQNIFGGAKDLFQNFGADGPQGVIDAYKRSYRGAGELATGLWNSPASLLVGGPLIKGTVAAASVVAPFTSFGERWNNLTGLNRYKNRNWQEARMAKDLGVKANPYDAQGQYTDEFNTEFSKAHHDYMSSVRNALGDDGPNLPHTNRAAAGGGRPQQPYNYYSTNPQRLNYSGYHHPNIYTGGQPGGMLSQMGMGMVTPNQGYAMSPSGQAFANSGSTFGMNSAANRSLYGN